MKPGGKDGKLYAIEDGAEIKGGTSSVLSASGFYRVTGIASSSSSLPGPAADQIAKGARKIRVGDVVHLWKNQALATGDNVKPLTLTLIGFVKDVSNSKQRTSYDVSTQENLDSGIRAWITSAFTDSNGTINGTVETDSEQQRTLLNQFESVAVDDGENYAIYPAKESNQDYMLSRRETNIAGETAVWEHFPVIVESIQMDKPLDGEQNFNFNYKVDGDNNPGVIYYKVKEEVSE